MPTATNSKKPQLRTAGLLCLAFVVAFISINALMAVAYHGRELPQTHIGRLDVSNRTVQSISALGSNGVLPLHIVIRKDAGQAQFTPAQLGMSANVMSSMRSSEDPRRWLPLVSLFRPYIIPLQIHVAPPTYDQIAASLAKLFVKTPEPAHIVMSGATVAVAPATSGYSLSVSRLRNEIIAAS